jgi:hypothetical protein
MRCPFSLPPEINICGHMDRMSICGEGEIVLEPTKDNTIATKYQFNNTMYQVRSVFKDTPKTELLEDKIKRLILKDNDIKPPAA